MTMPSERTRSIIQTREFLVDLSRDKTLPEAVRTEARLWDANKVSSVQIKFHPKPVSAMLRSSTRWMQAFCLGTSTGSAC